MRIYFDRLPFSANERVLRDLFGEYGRVERIKIQRTDRGASAGWGWLDMPDPTEAETALHALQGVQLGRWPLKLRVGVL